MTDRAVGEESALLDGFTTLIDKASPSGKPGAQPHAGL
jgi:hypothetical protein